MQGQVRLLKLDPATLDAHLDQVQIDPGFTAFVARAEQLGLPLRIVSDGLDYAIHRILANHGLSRLPVVANHLRWCEDHWELESPYQSEGCRSGTCKCTCAAQARANEAPHVLMIGDGSSDFCVSEDADFVFAKRRLITHCTHAGIEHAAIDTFHDAIALLPRLLDGSLLQPRRIDASPQPTALPLLLATACAMVLLGTLYPLLADALSLGKISVGPPYFGSLFLLLMAPMILLLPFGPLVKWQRDQPSRAFALLAPWLALAIVLGALAWWQAPQNGWKAGLGVAAAAWVGFGTARFVWQRLRGNGRFTAEMLGMIVAHAGIALFLAGALLVEALNVQREVALAPGQQLVVGRHEVRFEGVDHREGPNFISDRGHLRVFRNGREQALLHPEKRQYASGGQVMTEAGIDARFDGDVYVALGEPLGNNAWAVRVHIKPFVRWIWLGALLMALGGFITAADRRFRRP
ncbi:hypothetical protein G6F22_012307 [Rhizopus arrhizus]|nr:hypothetical protein G6F22_012307 [Rhizopus arrhizus]